MSVNPVIIIPGIGQSKLFIADKNGNKTKNAWPVEIDEKALVNDLKGSLMKMLIFRNDGGFSDKVASVANDITDPLAVNPDGTKKHNVKTVSYDRSIAECSAEEKRFIYKMVPLSELGEKIGEDKMFFFAFDPFGDIYDTADNLDEFVSFVKEKTGSEKVNIISVSVGGVVLKAYLHKFGTKNETEKILNVVSALDGTHLAADLFEDKLSLDNPAQLLSSFGGKAASLASAVGMLPQDVINNTVQKSLNVLKNNLLINCTTMWALIPDGRFDGIYEKMKASMHPLLAKKVLSLREYSLRFAESVKDKKFYQLCGWGTELVPVVSGHNISSDGVIDTHSASFGAVCESVGSKPDIYGCVFPDTTWFFKDLRHNDASNNDVLLSLAVKIMTGEIENISSDPAYPQFIDSNNNKAEEQ